MLNFDIRGNLKPYEPITTDLKSLKKYFVDEMESDTRLDNYKNYLRYSKDLKALLGGKELKQWVNGSFVTRKKNPKDIDLVTFLDMDTIEQLGEKLNDFRPANCWEVYGVDAYIIAVYPFESKHFIFTKADILEWGNLFGHTRLNRKGERFGKGFLEIFY